MLTVAHLRLRFSARPDLPCTRIQAALLFRLMSRLQLEQKLAANYARRQREAWLKNLPADLGKVLAEAAYLVPPETDTLRKAWYKLAGFGTSGRATPGVPNGYLCEFAFASEALTAVLSFPPTYDHLPAYLQIYDQPPLFKVSFGWARENFTSLFNASPYSVAVVSRDMEAGIFLDTYCGQLPDQPTEDEVVYELAMWNPGA